MSVDARIESAALDATKGMASEQLVAALSRLDRLLEAACNAAEKAYGATTDADPYRAFYVSPQDFRTLLGRPAGAPLLYVEPDDAGEPTPFAAVQRAFGLSAFDIDVLTIALAPEIDLRYQRLMAYLQDDVTRKRPSVDLALNLLCPTAGAKLAARRRFAVDAPLIRHRLLQLAPSASGNGPFLARELELDDAVVASLTTTITSSLWRNDVRSAPSLGCNSVVRSPSRPSRQRTASCSRASRMRRPPAVDRSMSMPTVSRQSAVNSPLPSARPRSRAACSCPACRGPRK